MRSMLLLVLCVASCFASTRANEFVIQTTPVNPKHTEIHSVLMLAYKNAGIAVEFTSLPYTRGVVSANYGVIDGVDIRLEGHVLNYGNLVRVDVPIHMAQTQLIVNRELCDLCDISNVRNLATVAGYGYEKYLPKNKLTSLEVQDFPQHDKLFSFFDGERVDAIIVSDIFLPSKYMENPKYDVITLDTQRVYHYLNAKHKGVAKQLERSFRRVNERLARGLGIHDSDDTLIAEDERVSTGASVAPAALNN